MVYCILFITDLFYLWGIDRLCQTPRENVKTKSFRKAVILGVVMTVNNGLSGIFILRCVKRLFSFSHFSYLDPHLLKIYFYGSFVSKHIIIFIIKTYLLIRIVFGERVWGIKKSRSVMGIKDVRFSMDVSQKDLRNIMLFSGMTPWLVVFAMEETSQFGVEAVGMIQPAIMILFVFSLYVFMKVNKINSELLNTYREVTIYLRLYTKTVNDAWMSLRIFRHDIKKQYLLEYVYLQKQDYIRLEEEYLKILDMPELNINISGNPMLDAVIISKKEQADKAQIQFVFRVSVPADLRLDDFKIVRLLLNLLDNAENATILLEEDRYISIGLLYDNGNLLIECRNTCASNDSSPKKIIDRGKQNNSHGLGIEIIKDVVNFYHGSYESKIIYEKGRCIYSVNALLFSVDSSG